MAKQLFAKLNESGELIKAPHHYQDDSAYIMNFDECEELMLDYGYKPVVGEEPIYNRLTQELIIEYKEEKDCIRKLYTIIDKNLPQFEVNSIDMEDEIIESSNDDIDIRKENEELKKRIEDLEQKQQELFNLLNSFISECNTSLNKVNNLEDSMIGVKNNIRKFNNFIDFYNSTKRD